MVPLRTNLTLGLDAVRPVHHQRIARAAVVRSNLLRPLEWGIGRVSPTRVEVGVGVGIAQFVELVELVLDAVIQAIQHDHLVPGAGQATFGAGTVVTPDVEEQRVVELAQRLQRIHDAAHLVVGVGGEAGKDLHLAGVQALLVGGQIRPVLDSLGLPGELRALRHDPQLDLPRQCLLPILVPAHVETAAILPNPLFGNVEGSVRGARREVDEEGLLGSQRLLEPHPLDGFVRQIGRHVVVGIVVGNLDWGHAVVQERRPLVGLTADEPVELVEPRTRGPTVVRARYAHLPRRGLMVLFRKRPCCTR